MSKLTENEIWVLKQFVCLPAEFHSYDLAKELINPEESQKEDIFSETIEELSAKGWLLKNQETGSYKMHRIIADVIKKQQTIALTEIYTNTKLFDIYLIYESNNFKEKGYRFYFLSNEERRMHVHVFGEDGEAKFWIEPIISLANYYGLNKHQLNTIQKLVEKNKNAIIKEWKRHFNKR